MLREVEKRLEGFDVDIIYSQDLYLDILPKNINKGSAMVYLAKVWNIDRDRIIACGDSGNDIAMLEVVKSIVVGNAKRELIEWTQRQASASDSFMARESFARGIIEGLRYFKEI